MRVGCGGGGNSHQPRLRRAQQLAALWSPAPEAESARTRVRERVRENDLVVHSDLAELVLDDGKSKAVRGVIEDVIEQGRLARAQESS